jgi:hypothetical protein
MRAAEEIWSTTRPPHVEHQHEVTVVADLSDTRAVDVIEETLRCRECGLRELGLILASPEWVHRRVESVSFRDDRTVRRRVSVDFSVPAAAPVLVVNGCRYRLLPLTIMRRKSLVNFDLRDEADASVPLLGLRQNQAVTHALAEAWACAVLDVDDLDVPERDFVHDLVNGTQEQLSAACAFADGAHAPPGLRSLVTDRRFIPVKTRLTEDFVMFVLAPDDHPGRRIYKFRYDEPLSTRYRQPGTVENGYARTPPFASRLSRLPILAALGWRPARIRFPTPAAENARSFHLEVHAPEGVEIDSASLLAGRPKRQTKHPSVDTVTGGFPTVDLHVVDVERGSVSRGQVDLRLANDSWLRFAFLSAWVSVGALVWAAHRLGAHEGRGEEAPSALFITFAAALAAILWRPQERRMATRMLSWVNVIAYGAPFIMLNAAALIVFQQDWDLTWWFTGLAGVAAMVAGVLTVTWLSASLAHRRVLLSPWEQGLGTGHIDRAERATPAELVTLAGAEHHLGFDTLAIKVASAEANSTAALSVDRPVIDEMRELLADRLEGISRATRRL